MGEWGAGDRNHESIQMGTVLTNPSRRLHADGAVVAVQVPPAQHSRGEPERAHAKEHHHTDGGCAWLVPLLGPRLVRQLGLQILAPPRPPPNASQQGTVRTYTNPLSIHTASSSYPTQVNFDP